MRGHKQKEGTLVIAYVIFPCIAKEKKKKRKERDEEDSERLGCFYWLFIKNDRPPSSRTTGKHN